MAHVTVAARMAHAAARARGGELVHGRFGNCVSANPRFEGGAVERTDGLVVGLFPFCFSFQFSGHTT